MKYVRKGEHTSITFLAFLVVFGHACGAASITLQVEKHAKNIHATTKSHNENYPSNPHTGQKPKPPKQTSKQTNKKCFKHSGQNSLTITSHSSGAKNAPKRAPSRSAWKHNNCSGEFFTTSNNKEFRKLCFHFSKSTRNHKKQPPYDPPSWDPQNITNTNIQ